MDRPKLTYNPMPPMLDSVRRIARMNDPLTALDLNGMESRLDAFGEWFLRVIDGASYDRSAAIKDWEMLDRDERRLLEQARARAI